tara:strand:+ start:742 stop:2001 length:1260 start_codon:yes stop_codon:yes gene_type:complete
MEIIKVLVPTGAQAKQYDIITRAVSDRSSIESVVDLYNNKFITEPRAGDVLANFGRSNYFNVQSKSSREMYKYVIAEKHKILTTSKKEENISLYAINKHDVARLEDIANRCKKMDLKTVKPVFYRRIPMSLNKGTIISTTGRYSTAYKDTAIENVVFYKDEVYIACDDNHTETTTYTEFLGEDVVSFIPIVEDSSDAEIELAKKIIDKINKSQYDAKIISEKNLGRYCRCYKTKINRSLYTKINHLLNNLSTKELGVKLFYKFDLDNIEQFDFKSMFYLSLLYNNNCHSINNRPSNTGNNIYKIKNLSEKLFNSSISFELFLTNKLEKFLDKEEINSIRKEFLNTFKEQSKFAAERFLPKVSKDEYTIETDITSEQITIKIKLNEANGNKTTEFLERFIKNDERTREVRPKNVVEQVEY